MCCDVRRPASIFIVLIVMALLIVDRAIAEIPAWVQKPPRDRNALFVVGIATASSLEIAQRAAILNAAVQVTDYLGLNMEGTGTKLRTAVEQQLTEELKYSMGPVPLRGILIREWQFEEIKPGTYQVFVLIRYPFKELEKTKTRLEAEQAELISKARMDIQKGQGARKKGKVMLALQSFSEALYLGREAGNKSLELEADNQMSTLLQSFEILTTLGDNQAIERGQRPQVPLVARVITRLEGEKLPAEGIPVLFSLGNELPQIKETIITDSDGIAQLALGEQWAGLSAGVHQVWAKVDREALFAHISPTAHEGATLDTKVVGEQLGLPGVTFTLKVVPKNRTTRVLLLIEESKMGKVQTESITMQALSEALQQAGFQVVADHEIGRDNQERLRTAIQKDHLWPLRPELSRVADLIVTGTATTRKGSDNMGVVISSHVDVFIRAVDLNSGHVVAQKNLVGFPGFGDTLELAGVRALKDAGKVVSETLVNQLALWEEVRK